MDLEPAVRRALWTYGATYAAAWFAVALVVGPGAAEFVRLSQRADASGGFIALYFAGAAAGAYLGGRAIARRGRVRVTSGAHAAAGLGLAAAGAGVALDAFAAFAAGTLLFSFGLGTIFLTRAAVADLLPPAMRGRAVARMQLAAGAGAIAGPALLVASPGLAALTGWDPWQAVWWVAPPLFLASALVVRTVPATARVAPLAPDPRVPGRRRVRPSAPLVTGMLGLSFAQGAMIMSMGVTGAALTALGHGLHAIGGVLGAHFLGMFALSTIVGRVADAWGRRRTLLLGTALLALGGLVLATRPGLVAFAVALFLVGVGWSLAFIASTVLVADVAPPGRSARLLGLADLATAALAIAASLAGGALYARQGTLALGLVAVALASVPAVAAALLREPRPGAYGAPEPVAAPAA